MMQFQTSNTNDSHANPGSSSIIDDNVQESRGAAAVVPNIAKKKYDAEALFGKFPK